MKGLRTYRDAVALVTGGGSGIGRALSEELSRRGAQVIVADIRPEAAEETAAAVQKAGGRASAAKLDVRDYSAFDSLAGRIWKDHGRLDYFFNNAGTGVFGDTRFSAPEDWNLTI
ncbi:MAG: SDR family NAD(P)-dependent oxidoreductase, partial [Bdellovibrionota bacterium]